MRSMLELSRRVVRDPRDYDARAGIMWGGACPITASPAAAGAAAAASGTGPATSWSTS